MLDRNHFVESLGWAAENGVRIINASFCFGYKSGQQTVYSGPVSEHIEAIREFGAAGGILICAAGNDQRNTDTNPAYPAAYSNSNLYPTISNVISVGSVDESGGRSSFSNYGVNSVDIYAPGSDILSTFPEDICEEHDGVFYDGTCLCEWSEESRINFYQAVQNMGISLEQALNSSYLFPDNEPSHYAVTTHYEDGYHYMSGTSMATPHVTGVAALLLSINPELTVAQLCSTILSSAETITITTPSSTSQTVKSLNAHNAVKYILGNQSPSIALSTSQTDSDVIDPNGADFYETNYFKKLNVTSAGEFDFVISSASALVVVLYDSNFNEIDAPSKSTNSGSTIQLYGDLAAGTYYLKASYIDEDTGGTISITIAPHTHNYDRWAKYNKTDHIRSCACGLRGTQTAKHVINHRKWSITWPTVSIVAS